MADAKAIVAAPATVADAMRRWIDANEKGLNGFIGVGTIPIIVHYDTLAKNGVGEFKVRLGS